MSFHSPNSSGLHCCTHLFDLSPTSKLGALNAVVCVILRVTSHLSPCIPDSSCPQLPARDFTLVWMFTTLPTCPPLVSQYTQDALVSSVSLAKRHCSPPKIRSEAPMLRFLDEQLRSQRSQRMEIEKEVGKWRSVSSEMKANCIAVPLPPWLQLINYMHNKASFESRPCLNIVRSFNLFFCRTGSSLRPHRRAMRLHCRGQGYRFNCDLVPRCLGCFDFPFPQVPSRLACCEDPLSVDGSNQFYPM